MRKDLSMYVHIPFCESKCSYCAFNSSVCSTEGIKAYLVALKKEIDIRSRELGAEYHIATLYIGGGTPSVLSAEDMKDLLSYINRKFVIKSDAEITIEINPNSITEEKAKAYLASGVNRFSIGLQAVQPHLLKMLKRTHTAKDFANAVRLLSNLGAENISADIIIALPNQTKEDVVESIHFANSLGVDHISTYLLELEEGTGITKLVSAGMLQAKSEKEAAEIYKTANRTLKKLGFQMYELSNFAKSSEKESKHNKVYWSRGEYIGLGLDSHSFLKGERFANTGSQTEYIKYLNGGQIPLSYKDKLTTEEIKEEIIMLSLRRKEGLDVLELKKQSGFNILKEKKRELADLIKDRYMVLTEGGHLRLTEKGYLVINKIIEILAL